MPIKFFNKIKSNSKEVTIPEELKLSYATTTQNTIEKFDVNAFKRWRAAIVYLYHPVNFEPFNHEPTNY